MKKHLKALALTVLVSTQIMPAFAADDWVEDDKVSGFYKRGVTNAPDEYNGPPRNEPPPEAQYAPQGGVRYGAPQMDELGGLGNPPEFSNQFSQPGMQNRAPAGNFQQPPQPKGFLGKAKSFGKSVINAPKNMLMGADDMLDDPGLWQSAGALAGMGANAYMNYRYMRNNPYYGGMYGGYNPYYGGMMPGYGVPFGAVNPLGGLGYNYLNNPYNQYGLNTPFGTGVLGNPYGNPYGGFYRNPFGMNNVLNPIAPYSPYGGYGLGGFGGYGLGGLGGFGGLGGVINIR